MLKIFQRCFHGRPGGADGVVETSTAPLASPATHNIWDWHETLRIELVPSTPAACHWLTPPVG